MTTSTGETVTIYESDLLARDDATLMSWANFFAWLYHGPELASLTIYQAPLSEVEQICGDDALGCYSPTQKILVFPGDLGQGMEAEIGAHEYGHHVAANRRNDPWDANDYGPKRWASYVGVCAKAAAGTVFPGDEADHYKLNTGEAFAEAYRILNQQRGGTWAYPPLVVDLSLAPDAGAMAAALTDVQQPWAGPVATSWDGQFPPITALTANVGPGKTISVRTGSGTLVKTLTAGTYAITVRDLSTTDDFHLSGGPTVNRKTSVPGTVTTLWKLILPPGSYRYYSDTHPGLAHSFTVTTPAQSALQPQERTLATPLDGTYQTTVTGTAHPSLELIDPTTGQDLVAATQGSITYTICGQRSLRLRILPTNAGSFHLDTAQP